MQRKNVGSTEAYLKPCQTSKMERFAKIVNGWKPLTIFGKYFIIDVWQDLKYASASTSKQQSRLSQALAFFWDLSFINFISPNL